MTERIFKKYLTLLLIYIIIVRFVGFYGLRLYFTLADSPKMPPATVLSFQSMVTTIEFALNILIVILMLIDLKAKKAINWLVILITLFNPDIGIVLFIVWSFYKDWIQKYQAQQL